jgi:hypothetical protein
MSSHLRDTTLVWVCHEMTDIIMSKVVIFVAALQLAKDQPATLERMIKCCDGLDKRIKSDLQAFERELERALQLSAEPGASPNGGPAERFGNSEARDGPPSVS